VTVLHIHKMLTVLINWTSSTQMYTCLCLPMIPVRMFGSASV